MSLDLLLSTIPHILEVIRHLNESEFFFIVTLACLNQTFWVDAGVDDDNVPVNKFQLFDVFVNLRHNLKFEMAWLSTVLTGRHLLELQHVFIGSPKWIECVIAWNKLKMHGRDVSNDLINSLFANVVEQFVVLTQVQVIIILLIDQLVH